MISVEPCPPALPQSRSPGTVLVDVVRTLETLHTPWDPRPLDTAGSDWVKVPAFTYYITADLNAFLIAFISTTIYQTFNIL